MSHFIRCFKVYICKVAIVIDKCFKCCVCFAFVVSIKSTVSTFYFYNLHICTDSNSFK